MSQCGMPRIWFAESSQFSHRYCLSKEGWAPLPPAAAGEAGTPRTYSMLLAHVAVPPPPPPAQNPVASGIAYGASGGVGTFRLQARAASWGVSGVQTIDRNDAACPAYILRYQLPL